MLTNHRKGYINKLGESFRANFEEKAGKKIGTGAYFDMTEVINYYGGIIEFADIYEEKYKLDSYICKIKEDEYDFKIVVDNGVSKSLKHVDKDGNECYGDWNLYIMKLFYYVVINDEKMDNMKNNEIIFPNSDYVKMALQCVDGADVVMVDESNRLFNQQPPKGKKKTLIK